MTLEGYCSRTSVYPGEVIGFHANGTSESTAAVAVRRWPDGHTLVELLASIGQHPIPTRDDAWACNWPPFATLQVPDDWSSGLYEAHLVAETDETASLLFVVKARQPASPRLLALPVATYQAYNWWPVPLPTPDDLRDTMRGLPGGGSLYLHDSPDRSRRTSLLRPGGWGLFEAGLWEQKFLRWAEAEGIDFDWCTSVDLHRAPELLHGYQLLLSVGHDEYWSKEMRDHVEAFVDGGGNAGFFSGNVCQWQIRFEDDDTTVACYKNPLEDPLAGVDDARVTVEWYAAPVERPTNTLTGVSVRNGAGFGWGHACDARREDAAYTVVFPEHWVFEGAPLAADGTFGRGENIVGYETDAVEFVNVDGIPLATGRDGTPESFVILATADLSSWRGCGHGGHATMGLFRRHGTVFTAATTDWSSGFENPSSAVHQITRNVISRLSTSNRSSEWELIGSAPEIVSMTKFEHRLFAVSADGRLRWREAATQNLRWRDIGWADDVVAIGATEQTSGRIVAFRHGQLCWRHGVDYDSAWHAMGDGLDNAIDLAGANLKIFAVANGGLWLRDPRLDNASWRPIDEAPGIVSLEAYWNALYGLGDDGVIRWRPTAWEPAPWQVLDRVPQGTRAIGVVLGRIVAATHTSQLWWRSLV